MSQYTKLSFFLSFICWIYFGQNVKAQSYLGLHFGRSYSKFDVSSLGQLEFYEHSTKFDHRGFKMGFFYKHHFNRFLSIEPQIGYAKRGTVITRDVGIVGYNKFSVSYLDFGVQTNVSLFKYITFGVGPAFNYLINVRSYWGADRSSSSKDFYEPYDFGLRPEITFSFKNIILKTSYFHGITPIREIEANLPVPGNPIIEKTGYRNRSLEFSIGYQIDIKKGIRLKRKD